MTAGEGSDALFAAPPPVAKPVEKPTQKPSEKPRKPHRNERVPAVERPVARVAVDVNLAHLDRAFDYQVPELLSADAVPGARVRVRFAGRLVDGFVLAREDTSEHTGRLGWLEKVVSPEPVLGEELAGLCRAVADRYAGTLADVLRLAVPPRHARVEAETPPERPEPCAPATHGWGAYPRGPALLEALEHERPAHAVWQALPGEDWPARLAEAAATTAVGGRSAVIVVPDRRDLDRVQAACAAVAGEQAVVALAADLGPAERYRRWLAVARGQARIVVGTRATAFAPVTDPGLIVVWDDGDDSHAEPRAPYPHARDVAMTRAHRDGAALLVGGFARTAEAALLVSSGWAHDVVADRATVRARGPRVTAIGEDDRQLLRDPAARAARMPSVAFEAARAALTAGAPVLVQVPRKGYLPAVACGNCREPARCRRCAGPLALPSSHGDAAPVCRWCGHPDAAYRCGACGSPKLRALAVGSARTAEELGRAFPQTVVRSSGGGATVLDHVPGDPALVVATPGAEPVAAGGYGAALLLDGAVLLARPELRAGEETLRRWFAAAALVRPAGEGGRVVVVADSSTPAVQALVRWDPAGSAATELAARDELALPPAMRMAAVDGPPPAVADLLAALPTTVEVLGPVELPPGTKLPGAEERTEGAERCLVRVPRTEGRALAKELHAAQAVRSARKERESVRVLLDPLDPL
ncbi:replication restart DNA helicase PriA [Actinomycetospora succinea]|uniref:Probable replication restart protein PriA n=1 Tax=Actinomycetospora succinea TaxID=663603 RepID=A0A4R6UL24_9PSEU|nr:primosomal protein N' [Actinomycetospora succinea]TDQ46199.1 replication restart DNA helicase PriA [Actinomycetospora succinea]